MPWLRFLASALCVAALSACTQDARWEEEVVTHDGKSIRVERYARFNDLHTSLPGGQGNLIDEIAFQHGGRRIEWERAKSALNRQAVIFDVLEGVPVVVVPVRGLRDCTQVGFPYEGYAVYAWRDGEWRRLDAARLAKGMKINLVNSWHVMTRAQYHGQLVLARDKTNFEHYGIRLRQGTTLEELGRQYASGDEACIRYRPPANQERDALAQELQKALAAAARVPAVLRAEDPAPKSASRDDYWRAHGKWTGWGWLRDCEGVVERIGPLREATMEGSSSRVTLTGYEVVLQSADVSVKEVRLLSRPLDYVICAEGSVYLLQRPSADVLRIAKLSAQGRLMGAATIEIPGAAPPPKTPWAELWDPRIAGGVLAFTLARYKYDRTATEGGVLNDTQHFAAALPF